MYRLYSDEHHRKDRAFFTECLSFVRWLESANGSPTIAALVAVGGKGNGAGELASTIHDLKAKATVCERSEIYFLSRFDETYQIADEAFNRLASKVHTLATQLLWKLIKLDVDRRDAMGPGPLMLTPSIAALVRRLYPLQAFLDAPGIIVCTAAKAGIQAKVYARAERGKGKRFDAASLAEFIGILNDPDSLVARQISPADGVVRALIIPDEEEESYWYLFKHRKSVVNPGGRNDLNSVITEFVQYFDIKWPFYFGTSLGSRIYRDLEHFAAIAEPLENDLNSERERTGANYIPNRRIVALQRQHLDEEASDLSVQYTDAELLKIHEQLHMRNDGHRKFERFREKASVLKRLRAYIAKIAPEGADHYEVFRSTIELIGSKKYFTMSRVSYGELLDQPGQTFFTQTAGVMDTEFQRQVQIERDTADQTLRLNYRGDGIAEDAFTLHDYLRFIMFMARVLSKSSGRHRIAMSEADKKRYADLASFLRDVRELFKTIGSEDVEEADVSDEQLFTEEFLFESVKSIVTLEESWYQAEEYNKSADICLTLTISSLRGTPEGDIIDALARTNGVYPLSATGALVNASSGAFNMRYLGREVERIGGRLNTMSAHELELVGQFAEEKALLRDRDVALVDEDAPAHSFKTWQGFGGLVQMVEDAMPKYGEEGYANLNVHKRNEIKVLLATLDKLMATRTRSGLAICQTVQHIRKAFRALAATRSGFVRQLDDTGDHFVVQAAALPTYRRLGQTEDIHVILYSAARFRKVEKGKAGTSEADDDEDGQFCAELQKALDITGKKVLLWTAYGSASRGINFITTQSGQERDFELFCLVNDPYYTRHTRPGTRGFSIEAFQSFMQVIRDEDPGWAARTIGSVLYEFSRSPWKRLRKEHYIDITRTVFQALGRGERRPDNPMPRQQIFVSSSAAQSVCLGVRFAPELRERASAAQRAVLMRIDRSNQESQLYPTMSQRRTGHLKEVRKAVLFRYWVRKQPVQFRTDQRVREMWGRLFSRDMFKDPEAYVARVGDDVWVSNDYAEACYLRVPVACQIYTIEQVTPVSGAPEFVITDAADGTDAYRWTERIAPPSLVQCLSSATRRLLKPRAGFAVKDDLSRRWVPQPWFVTEIMKGFFAELEFEEYVHAQFNVRPGAAGALLSYIDIQRHPLYAELFQLFDYYLEREPDVWVAVDVKNWSRATDAMQKDELAETAEEKHARLAELLPNVTVHAVYVNLYGAHKFTIRRPRRGSIQFMSLYVQENLRGWIRNTNLDIAMLGT